MYRYYYVPVAGTPTKPDIATTRPDRHFAGGAHPLNRKATMSGPDRGDKQGSGAWSGESGNSRPPHLTLNLMLFDVQSGERPVMHAPRAPSDECSREELPIQLVAHFAQSNFQIFVPRSLLSGSRAASQPDPWSEPLRPTAPVNVSMPSGFMLQSAKFALYAPHLPPGVDPINCNE